MRMRMRYVAGAAGAIVAVAAVATLVSAAPPVRTRSDAQAAALGAGSSSVVTSTYTLAPTSTLTPTSTSTLTPTLTSRPTLTPTSTLTPTLTPTLAPTSTPSPTPAPVRPTIYLPTTRRAVTDPTADRVAARLMAMLDRPGERDRLIVWDWEAGVALVALMTAYGDGRDPRVVEWVDAWLARAVRDGWVALDAPALAIPNHIAPAWGALLRDAHVGDGRHEALLVAARAWLTRPPGEGGAARVALPNGALGLPEDWPGAWAHLPDRPELWDDTLFMAAPFLARYGRMHGDAALVDEAALQILGHARILADPATGVWRHGWSQAAGDHMSGGRWARGNAWAALAATEVLESLPADSPLHAEVRLVLAHQLAGLAKLQASSGLWHTEVTRFDFYTETSGSAGIVAALYRAIAAGWLPASFRTAADRGFEGVTNRIAADGTVMRVSMGTGVPSAAQGIALYNTIDASRIQPYGQGLVLLMFEARERADAAVRNSGGRSP